MHRVTSSHCCPWRPGRCAVGTVALICVSAFCSAAQPVGKQAGGKPPVASDPAGKLLAEGWRQLELVNYPAAEEAFNRIRKGKARPAQRAEATFGLGHLYQYRRPGADVGRAAELYREVAGKYKDTPSSALALMALACLADTPEHEKDRRRDEARSLYRQIIEQKPDSFVVHEAVLRLAMTYVEEHSDPNMARGMRMLAEHLQSRPDNFLATAMHNQLAVAYVARDDIPKAVKHFQASDAADERAAVAELTDEQRTLPLKRRLNRISQNRIMDAGTRASLYYRIGRLAEVRLRDYPLAVKWYERVVYEAARDNRFYPSKRGAERCRKLAAQAGKAVPRHPLAGGEARP